MGTISGTSGTTSTAGSTATVASGPVGSVQGLASGIQWRDIVDQLSALDKAQQLDPVTNAISAAQTQEAAWAQYSTVSQTLNTAATALRDGSAIDSFQVTAPNSITSGRALVNGTATSAAAPGTYQVEVDSLAQAEKLSGAAFASASNPLGIAGDFAVDGMKVSLTATDSLNSIRDKINALDSGANPSGVTATVLATANGSSRLVMTSDASGAHGIELVDSASTGGVLQQLGVVDGTYAGGVNPDGTATSGAFTSTSVSIGQLLGMTAPGATTIRVGNKSISVDLSTDTLDSLAAKITAAGVAASAVTTTDTNSVSRSRLQVNAAISAVPDSVDPTQPDANSLRVLQMLGVVQGGRSAIGQSVSSTALTDGTNATATATTLLTDVQANGASANIQAGDTITISGKRGDGTAVSFQLSVGAGSTINDLLTQINSSSGFGGGTRPATATVGTDGKIHLADGTSGDSQLTMSLSVNKSGANGGGSTSIGAFGVDTIGRARQVSAGADAQIVVDGVTLTRSTNNITDAISGVTLNLQQAEKGTTVGVTVARNTQSALTAINAFVSAYNALQSFATTDTATGGDLQNNTALKSSAHSFTNALLTDVLGASITRGALIGIALDKTGVLQVDATKLAAALNTNAAGVKSLFALSGSATGSGLSYVGSTDATQGGAYNVVITAAATQGTAVGSGATYPYASGGASNHLTILDSATNTTSTIALGNGDDANALAARLNTMFSTQRSQLSATVIGGQLSITSNLYGATGAFTVSYDSGDTTSATQLGIAAGSFVGTDVAGTINGVVAKGNGQALVGAIGDPSAGVVIKYTGSALGAIGAVTVTTGLAEQFARMTNSITATGTGMVAMNTTALDSQITLNQTRSSQIQERLTARQNALIAQFTAMETAIQAITAQGNSITSALNALSNSQSSSKG